MKNRFPNSRNGSVLWLLTILVVFVTPLAYMSKIDRSVAVETVQAVGPQNNPIPGLTWETTPSPSHVEDKSHDTTPVQDSIPADSGQEGIEMSAYEQEIREVFGTHADKALKLLTCENSSHNPDAKNYNNDDVQSIDYGIFQINDHWQGIRHKGKAEQFLLDPSINIRIAWRIYQDDGYSFKLWTCGRKLGL